MTADEAALLAPERTLLIEDEAAPALLEAPERTEEAVSEAPDAADEADPPAPPAPELKIVVLPIVEVIKVPSVEMTDSIADVVTGTADPSVSF